MLQDIPNQSAGTAVVQAETGLDQIVQFANICVQKRMNRFTLRTKLKVDVEWRLFALVHKIGKIHTFGAYH